MDIHTRIAAILHIVTAVLMLFVVLLLGAAVGAFGALGPSIGVDPDIAAWVGGLGMMLVCVFALIAVAELVGAVMLLRGSDAGRIITIVFSVLDLVVIPVGTAIGIYSLWALLRTPSDPTPTPTPTPTPIPAGARQPY
jgi:hypothetical protein